MIVPAYNAGQYVERCLTSVLNLPLRLNLLITVVNDGSTDNTAEVLLKYEDNPRVEVITQENRGFFGARNRGLDDVKSRYIMFMDSDDELLWGVDLDSLLQFVDTRQLDILECGYVTFSDSSDLDEFRLESKVANHANGLLHGYPWGKLIRAELFEKVRFPEGYWFEDTVMSFVVFPMCKKVDTSSTLLYHYRINPAGITATSRGRAKSVDTYWVTEQLLRDRATLGLKNDEEFAKVMLDQVRMNYGRLRNLGRLNVQRAVFVLTSRLWRQYFGNINVESPLAYALADSNFLRYRLLLEFSWI